MENPARWVQANRTFSPSRFPCLSFSNPPLFSPISLLVVSLSRCLVVRLFAHRASFRFLGYVSSFGQSVLHLKARISKRRNRFYVRAVSDCPARSIGRSRPVFLNLEYRPVGLLLPREKFRQATVIESDVFCSSRGKFLEFSPLDSPCFLYGL